jgi:hypothetical protein
MSDNHCEILFCYEHIGSNETFCSKHSKKHEHLEGTSTQPSSEYSDAIDELFEQYVSLRPFERNSPVAYRGFKAAIEELLLKAQHNCNNIAEDQPNDVHIGYFNNGYKMAMSKVDKLLLKARKNELENMWDKLPLEHWPGSKQKYIDDAMNKRLGELKEQLIAHGRKT